MNKKVEWGVLCVADIAVKRVIPAGAFPSHALRLGHGCR
jgi:hypothetical protein